MKRPNTFYPLVKLPEDIQLSLSLIREELKCRKHFNALREAGLDDCYFQPHLDLPILRSIGLDNGTDELFSIYDEIMDKRSKKIEADNDSIMKQAMKVYQELSVEKKKQKC